MQKPSFPSADLSSHCQEKYVLRTRKFQEQHIGEGDG